MAGWKGSTRRATLPANWGGTQLRILHRDSYACRHIRQDTGRECLAPARQVDHIVNAASGGSDDDNNLQALCDYHHNAKSGREGGLAAGVARRTRQANAKPLHPGLLPEGIARPSRPAPADDTPAPF